MRYGRSKIKKIYQHMYEESISTHKIQRVINTHNIDKSNKTLTKWLIEYNTHRPHQSLNYDIPLEFVLKAIDNSPKSSTSKVLPMYPAHTENID